MVDWPGLLAWSTKYHDGTSPSKFDVMSKEDREFLQKAMVEMFATIEDPNKIFKDAVDRIRDHPSDEQALTSLEIIDRCCDDPDVARNVEVHDGLTPLLSLIDSTNSVVVARACEVLGLMIANNPLMQRAAFDKNALDKVLTACSNEEIKQDVPRYQGKTRLLNAIVRNKEEIEIEFVKRDGIAFLGECMRSGDAKIASRAVSLLIHLIAMQRTTATAETALHLAKAYSDLYEESLQTGEILSTCAVAHAETESVELREALRKRIKYIYARDDTTDFRPELKDLLETIRKLE